MCSDLNCTVARLVNDMPPQVLLAFVAGCIVTAVAATIWVYLVDWIERRAHAKRMLALSKRPRVSSAIVPPRSTHVDHAVREYERKSA